MCALLKRASTDLVEGAIQPTLFVCFEFVTRNIALFDMIKLFSRAGKEEEFRDGKSPEIEQGIGDRKWRMEREG